MMRTRRRMGTDVNRLEEELNEIKELQAALRQQIRRLRNSEGEVGKLEEKLTKQFASAKWTINQIRDIQPDWDERGFYQSVQARKPSPRGRRPRASADPASESQQSE